MDSSKPTAGLNLGSFTCPVDGIDGVWRFIRQPGVKVRAFSPPGHLLHLIKRGSYTLELNGRKMKVHPGELIYYYETEEVRCDFDEGELEFLSVNFRSRSIPPLPLDMRVLPSTTVFQSHFDSLLLISTLPETPERAFRAFAALLAMLLEVPFWKDRAEAAQTEEIWWEIERKIRGKRIFRPSLDELSTLGGVSRASVVRSCRKATGLSPMRRIQLIRMEEARGLLRNSMGSVSQTADYLGYPRLHEFSREFSRYFGFPPTHFRE